MKRYTPLKCFFAFCLTLATAPAMAQVDQFLKGDTTFDLSKDTAAPTQSLSKLEERYKGGERSDEFMIQYLQALAQAKKPEVMTIGRQWLSEMPLDKLATAKIWPLIMMFENDPLSKTLIEVYANKERFYAIPLQNQKEMVDAKLNGAMLQTAMEFAMNPNLATLQPDRYNVFVDYLAQVSDCPGKTMASIWLNTSLFSRQGDWQKMIEAMKEVKKNNLLPPQVYGQYFMFFLQSLTKMKDAKKAVPAGLDWLDELIAEAKGETAADYQTRTVMYAGKAALYHAMEDTEEVNKAQREMQRYAQLAQKAGGAQTPGQQVAAVASEGKSVMRYDDRGGAPVVEVEINGHTYRFLFDTCAGYTCVSDKLVNLEKLPYQQTGNTVIGMEGNLQMTSVPQLTLGGMVVNNAVAAIMSAQNPAFVTLGVDGIIGAPLINNYVLTIDSRTKTITLDKEADASIDQWTELKMHGTDPLLATKVEGKGEWHDVPALFDTGNGTGTIALPSAQGFEEWTKAGIIVNVQKGEGFNAMMIGGVSKTTDKLYRGELKDWKIGDGTFQNIPMMTGGMGYLLLPFKITDLGRITLDYPRKRFNFTAYPDAKVWQGDRRPVLAQPINGELRIAALYGEATKKLSVGDTITALDGKPLTNIVPNMPGIDVLIKQGNVQTVTVKNDKGKEKTVPAEVFIMK